MPVDRALATTVFFPGSSERYIDGTCVILAAKLTYPYQTPHFGIGWSPMEMRRSSFPRTLRSCTHRLHARCGGFYAAKWLAQVTHVLGVDDTMPASMPRARRNTLLTSCVRCTTRGRTPRRLPGVSLRLHFKRQQAGDRPENLFLGNAHTLSTSASTVGRRKLPPFRCAAGRTVYPDRPPAGLRLLQCLTDIAGDFFPVLLADKRPNLGFGSVGSPTRRRLARSAKRLRILDRCSVE